MLITVGSTNPVKIRAVQAVLQKIYPAATYTSLAVPSGVPAQPWGDEQTRRGAVQRAQNALIASSADLAVGLEGGVQETEFGLFTCAWAAIVHRNGRLGIGGSACTQLPDTVVHELRAGHELGPAMDALTGDEGIKYKGGAIGVLTSDLATRQSAYEVILTMALSPFLHPDWYGKAN